MIKSMTGYGRSMMRLGDADITVELRAVNNRYLDLSVKLPRSLSFCEDKIKSELQKRISRGKVDVYITYYRPQGEQVEVVPNLSAAKGYAAALKQIDEVLGTNTEINALTLARFSEVFTVNRDVPDEEAVWQDVKQVVIAAADNFNDMRANEGARMAADVLEKLGNIERLVNQVEEGADERVDRYRERLYQKMQNVLGNAGIDEKRILEEAAIYADHIAIDEETVRLHSHIEHFREIVAKGGPVGRKLDFLVQEINREINTTGSKADDLAITALVVELKSETEKIREQIQNIE